MFSVIGRFCCIARFIYYVRWRLGAVVLSGRCVVILSEPRCCFSEIVNFYTCIPYEVFDPLFNFSEAGAVVGKVMVFVAIWSIQYFLLVSCSCGRTFCYYCCSCILFFDLWARGKGEKELLPSNWPCPLF